MLKIKYELLNSKNEKVPVIDIENNSEDYWSLSNYLNDCDNQILSELLDKISHVENGTVQCEETGSESSIVKLEDNRCTIWDFFEVNPDVVLSLSEFKKIVIDWKRAREELLKEIENEKLN